MGLYKTIDNTLMKGANSVVRAYNWTTGKTKSQLVNSMLIVAPILEISGFIAGRSSLVPLSPVYLLLSHLLGVKSLR